jgi:D-amino peptidase
MKTFIAVDMEGISGVESVHDIAPGLAGYSTFRRVMAGDVNAAVDGAFRGGATEVVVADGHGLQTNLLPGDLDPRATLRSGSAQLVQFKGLTPDVDAAFLIGFHAKSGTPNGVLSHTFLSAFLDLRVNGRSIGEAELGTYFLASLGIPVVLLSGDDTAVAQVRPVLGGHVEYVAVKSARSRTDADHLPLSATHPLLSAAAERAMTAIQAVEPIQPLPEPIELEIDLALEPTDAMPDMLERNARFSDQPDARPMNDFEFLLSFEELDAPTEGTVRLIGSVAEVYRAVTRFAGYFMARTVDWIEAELAPRTPYTRDLAQWRQGAV